MSLSMQVGLGGNCAIIYRLSVRQLGSALGEPLGVVGIIYLAEAVGIDHCSGCTVDHSWGGVASAWHLLAWATGVISEGKSHPGSILHGGFEAILVGVSGDDYHLDVLCSVGVPLVVEVFQVSLEGSAPRSPRSGVQDHDDLVTRNSLCSYGLAVFVDKAGSEPVSHSRFKVKL